MPRTRLPPIRLSSATVPAGFSVIIPMQAACWETGNRSKTSRAAPAPSVSRVMPGKHQHLDHLPGAALLAMPFHQRLPDLIETRRPEASPALLLQRPRSRQCARLAIKHIEIMFQVEDLLLAPIT